MILGQPRRAVLAVQAHRQRVDAGPQRRHLAFGAALGGLQLGDPFVGQPQRGHRPVVVLVEPDLARVEFTDAALHGFELGLGLLRPRGRLFDPLGQPRNALVDGFHPGAHGVDLAGQPGQALAAVGFGAHGRQVRTFGLGGAALALGQLGAGGIQPASRDSASSAEQLRARRGHLVGLGLQRVGVGVAARRSARRRGAGRARWRCARWR